MELSSLDLSPAFFRSDKHDMWGDKRIMQLATPQ